jgi:hypothetical protein
MATRQYCSIYYMEATAARLLLEMNMIIENNHLHRIYIMIHFKFMVDCMIILIFMEHMADEHARFS